jgi:hypothetical protein
VYLRLYLSLGVLASAAALPAAPAPEDARGPVAIDTEGKGHIDFRAGKELVARYNIGPDLAKPYFWPLNAPGGVPVTRAWPMEKAPPGSSTDHPHQKSAWFCHGDVIPEGMDLRRRPKGVEGVDFWSEAEGHGRIVCTHVGRPVPAGGGASVVTRNEWRTADGRKVLDETRIIALYDLGDARLFVLGIDLHASAVPVTFGDTKEGSLGVRVNDAITEAHGKGKLENAEGKVGENAVWGRLSKWCDYSGPVDGHTVGVALFDDPANAPAAAWHSRGYGLMAANPFGRAKSGFPARRGQTDLVRLEKGGHLKLRYGLLLHTGDAKSGKVAEHYERFLKLKG